MNLTFFGHSCFQIKTSSTCILIDPFLPNLTESQKQKLSPDYILVTHGHGDHIGETVEIAQRCQATVIAIYELAIYFTWQGINAIPLGIGGTYTADFGQIMLTPASHSSGLINKDETITYLGEPTGFIISIEDKRLYHAGDTGIFGDMELLGELYPLDIALLPIGDKYTMGPQLAAKAAALLNAKISIPMHYNTFPFIAQQPDLFIKLLKEENLSGKILKPGETMVI